MPTTVNTARAQTNLSTYREKYDFAEGIAVLDPYNNPLTLLTMKVGKGSSGNIKHSWLEDEYQPDNDTVNYSTGYASDATAIVVDHGGRFAAGDLVMHNQTKEVMLVTSVSTNTLTVSRDYGQGSTPGYTARADTVDDGDYLTILSNAFEQGHDLPTMKSTVEVQRDNYCQDLRTPFGVSEIMAAAALYGAQDWPFQMKKKGIEHMWKVEQSNLWGVPEAGDQGLYASGTGNTRPATAGGIYYFINAFGGSDQKVTQAEITQSEFEDFLEAGFAYGSRSKVMLCPPLLRTALDHWGIAKLNTFVGGTAYGMKVARWESSHGNITFVTHNMLKDPGSDGAIAFLLDMDQIKWITYSDIGSTRLRMLDPYKSDGSTIKKAEYQTISCLEMKMPKHHAYLTGMTSYA